MNCKNCGSPLTDGTYCLRCGTDNANDDKKKPKVSNNIVKKVLSLYKKLLIFIVILLIIMSFQTSSRNSCKEKYKDSSCEIGSECKEECSDPDATLVDVTFLVSITTAYSLLPVMIGLFIYDKKVGINSYFILLNLSVTLSFPNNFII